MPAWQDPSASRGARPRKDAVEEDDSEVDRSRKSSLQHVGNVVWQSGFLLAEYLIRQPPFSDWGGVRVVDLGSGTGQAFPATKTSVFTSNCCWLAENFRPSVTYENDQMQHTCQEWNTVWALLIYLLEMDTSSSKWDWTSTSFARNDRVKAPCTSNYITRLCSPLDPLISCTSSVALCLLQRSQPWGWILHNSQ